MIWLYLLALLLSASGWGVWLAQHSASPHKALLAALLTLIVHSGALTLWMLFLGLIGIPLSVFAVWGGYSLLMGLGFGLMLHARARVQFQLPRKRWQQAVLGFLVLLCAAVLFNSTYHPFYRDDALGIYLPFAIEISETRALVPINAERNLYELYPQLASMHYAHIFSVAGWQNPYAAKLPLTLLSLGVLGATYLLGSSAFHDERVGWLAALTVALTPDFGNWASAGYVDLPMAFFYSMGLLFTLALWRKQRLTDAALAGLCLGLAAWTKNAALLGVGLFTLSLFTGLILRQIHVKHVMLGCSIVAIVVFAWYGRTLILAGALTPDTVWTEQARQTWRELLILVTLPQNYALAGWVMLVGLLRALVRGVRRQLTLAEHLLLGWSVPYFVVWFAFASYDPRFILLMLPCFAVLGALVLRWLLSETHFAAPIGVRLVGIILVGVLGFSVLWHSVDYKRAILQSPFMSHEAKQTLVRP